MWAASAGTIVYCSAKVKNEMDSGKVPLMGVLGAFIFAAQMINFTIPATGSSGHLGGGMILSILLGPYASFLTIASVLVVQALFFADGGLLALGCNIFNLGIFPAFIAYPLIYKKIAATNATQGKITVAAIASAVVGLQLGALGVVLETVASGISSLPFTTFVALMQPIHLAIGIVEGVVTAAVVSFVFRARPEIIQGAQDDTPARGMAMKHIVFAFLAISILAGGIVSRFASEKPDGLEWSIAKITGKEELEGSNGGVHAALARLQERLAFLPDYSFKKHDKEAKAATIDAAANKTAPEATGENRENGSDPASSLSGITGGLITLLIVFAIGYFLKRRSRVV
ncbi:putative fused nickel transport protein NikMN [Geobacter sp. OR-1]|nr:putative fused nickel transport protein NikMN [Geobacter sp. OR-1]